MTLALCLEIGVLDRFLAKGLSSPSAGGSGFDKSLAQSGRPAMPLTATLAEWTART
jgi:hypothetical protein